MIYLGRVPKGEIAQEYEFDGEHANSCSICKYNGNCFAQTNDLGVYYDPPHDCDSKEDCERFYKTFIEPYRHLESKWDLVKQA